MALKGGGREQCFRTWLFLCCCPSGGLLPCTFSAKETSEPKPLLLSSPKPGKHLGLGAGDVVCLDVIFSFQSENTSIAFVEIYRQQYSGTCLRATYL